MYELLEIVRYQGTSAALGNKHSTNDWVEGIGEQTLLPSLETPGTEVHIMMTHTCW